MEYYEARASIQASPDRVWALLTDAEGLPKWDSGISKVEGRIAAGSKFKLHVDVTDRAFALKVAEFDPPRRMVWSGGMPLGLFKGVRTFSLSEKDGGTEFHVREEFSGLMLPLIWKSMPDLGPSFEQFAKGLKAAAESAG